jgi:hypothetical protein
MGRDFEPQCWTTRFHVPAGMPVFDRIHSVTVYLVIRRMLIFACLRRSSVSLIKDIARPVDRILDICTQGVSASLGLPKPTAWIARTTFFSGEKPTVEKKQNCSLCLWPMVMLQRTLPALCTKRSVSWRGTLNFPGNNGCAVPEKKGQKAANISRNERTV